MAAPPVGGVVGDYRVDGVVFGFCRGCGAADGGGCWGGDVADTGAGFVAAEFASGVSAAHCRGVCDDCRWPVDDFGESGF